MAEVALPAFADLTRDLPRTSPRAWRFAALRLANRGGALLSDGLRTGYRQGFDSGAFMDHVYANRPSGRSPLGVALDRRLLSRPTCEAFRDIRELARRAVVEAIQAHPGDAPPVVADVAAGPAPYLLEAVRDHPGTRAVLRDIDPRALELARSAADQLGIADRVDVAHGDAFDTAALAALEPRPDIVLELGLYGIYHDDALIERHLRELGERVAPRQIVCNVQTRNAEIEYIARVWRNREGGPCVWRLRSHERILEWADAAGYAPASVQADRHGIYRVMRLVRKGIA